MTKKSVKSKKLVELPFPKATLKRIALRHKIQNNTRISEDGLEQLGKSFDELIGWIIRESERLATNEGKSTITSEHINDAIKIYFGEGG